MTDPTPNPAGSPAPAASRAQRDYPMPAPAHDPRFTLGLLIDVADVLAAHGFPPVRQPGDLIELQQSLFRFIYDRRTSGRNGSRGGVLPSGEGCAYASDYGTDNWHEHDHTQCQDAVAEDQADDPAGDLGSRG